MENSNVNVETVCGYTVYSYYIDGPDRPNKTLFTEKNRTRLRLFAFAALAPFALLADAIAAVFH